MEVQAAGRIRASEAARTPAAARTPSVCRCASIRPAVARCARARSPDRLGQTRDVLVKRFCFRNSVDAAICKLHDEIRAGRIAITDNIFPQTACRILNGNGE
jgi:hypothetical protein